VVGESLIDLIRRPGEPELARVGGSPLNVAVGLSRLDVPPALWTRLGPDEHGTLIAEHLGANGVAVVPDR
jgi:fructokinase